MTQKTTQINFRLTPQQAKSLKRYALEHDTTVQAILETAVDELLRKDDEK